MPASDHCRMTGTTPGSPSIPVNGAASTGRNVQADRAAPEAPPWRTALAAAWALIGVAGLLSFAMIRLGQRGITTVRQGLGPGEWIALVALTLVFVWIEGRRAFEKRWVPRVIARAAGLRGKTGLVERLFAPAYAMSLIGDSKRNVAKAWSLTCGIVAAVLLIASLAEPWRGIIDLAVAAALAWGVGALVVQTANRMAACR